jgi:gliding motility-associated-like protein
LTLPSAALNHFTFSVKHIVLGLWYQFNIQVMKRWLILLFVAVGMWQISHATHVAGADLQYRYIGDSTGIAHHYEIMFRFYRDAGGAGAPQTVNIQINSSCFAASSVNLPRDPLVIQGQTAPTLNDCVDVGPATGTTISQLFVYRNTVILNGVCADWRFSYSLCCRNTAVNVVGQPLYFIQVFLNNTLGENSSPIFISEPVRAFCVNRPFNWQQNAVEIDGDSTRFQLINPRSAVATNVPWQAGFSAVQPFRTAPPQSLQLNRNNGLMSFTIDPAGVGNYSLAIEVEEFRFDSVNQGWVRVGTSVRDMQITVAANCNSAAQAGVYLDGNVPGMRIDPITGLPTVDYDCRDSLITMYFAVDVDCSSISPDGTDFRMTDPNGQPVAIRRLIPNCDNDNATKTIAVDIYEPFRINGTYYLYSKSGTDGNTLFNKCGFDMPEFDTIAINVTGCFDPQLNMENVTIFENQYPIAQWAVDTSTFPVADFDAYEVYRSDGGQYTLIGSVTNVMQWEFEDQTGIPQVSTDNYRYRIRPIIRGRNFGDTRSIVSILLESDNAGLDTNWHNLTWNTYDGWDNVEYRIMIGRPDGQGGFNFTQHNQQGNPTNQTWYNFEGPTDVGQYAIRVDGLNPLNGQWEAFSNWILYGVLVVTPPPPPPPDPLIIPNVFTPNGDGYNDFFIVQGIDSYSGSEVSIYSRWGQVVYQRDNYQNDSPWDGKDMQGNQLADGVYFYVIKLNNQSTLELEEYKGTVTITKGGL